MFNTGSYLAALKHLKFIICGSCIITQVWLPLSVIHHRSSGRTKKSTSPILTCKNRTLNVKRAVERITRRRLLLLIYFHETELGILCSWWSEDVETQHSIDFGLRWLLLFSVSEVKNARDVQQTYIFTRLHYPMDYDDLHTFRQAEAVTGDTNAEMG